MTNIEVALSTLLAVMGFSLAMLIVWSVFRECSVSAANERHIELVGELVKSLTEVSGSMENLMGMVASSKTLDAEHKREFIEALRRTEDRIMSAIDKVNIYTSPKSNFDIHGGQNVFGTNEGGASQT